MSAAGRIGALRAQVVALSGGYFRNLIRAGTCQRCYTPVSTTDYCMQCRRDSSVAGLQDAIGFMTYASHADPIQQSGRIMRDYKLPVFPSGSAVRAVTLLAALALQSHRICPGRLVGDDPAVWALVPSLPPKLSRDHPWPGYFDLSQDRTASRSSCKAPRRKWIPGASRRPITPFERGSLTVRTCCSSTTPGPVVAMRSRPQWRFGPLGRLMCRCWFWHDGSRSGGE